MIRIGKAQNPSWVSDRIGKENTCVWSGVAPDTTPITTVPFSKPKTIVFGFPSQVTSAMVADSFFHLTFGCDFRSSLSATLVLVACALADTTKVATTNKIFGNFTLHTSARALLEPNLLPDRHRMLLKLQIIVVRIIRPIMRPPALLSRQRRTRHQQPGNLQIPRLVFAAAARL